LKRGADAGSGMITRRIVFFLGVSQLICWGISYYLIGGFGDRMASDLGWSHSVVYGGFTAALVVMGLTSPLIGRTIDRVGGRQVMVAGSLLLALGCAGLAVSHGIIAYYASWCCLGIAMRLTLYDAAFAVLARLGGVTAKRPMAQITLLGGLASTVLWPIGNLLAEQWGWRGALLCYAGFAVLTIPLHLAIPAGRYEDPPRQPGAADPMGGTQTASSLAGFLYVVIVTLTNFLNSGMSAHMIPILTGLGTAASVAVWIATLRGIGQSSARLCEVVFGQRLSPLVLAAVASSILPLCFIAGIFSGVAAIAGIAFAFLYGVGNGLITIVRGTMPLVLFDHRTYGATVGRLLTPSFLLSAVAPLAYALVIEHLGNDAALILSAIIGAVVFAAALLLWLRFRAAAPAG
jgi:predicted MFS family arabinose efflux permease